MRGNNHVSTYQNRVFEKIFKDVCTTNAYVPTNVFIYDDQYMMIPCTSDNKINILYLNGTLTGKTIDTNSPLTICTDPKKRFVVSKRYSIEILENNGLM